MVDILPEGLKSSRDVFAKVKRDAVLFDQDPTVDTLFNVMVTAWSLRDWIKVELTDQKERDKLDAWTESDRISKKQAKSLSSGDEVEIPLEIRLCRDLANASKHARISKATRVSSTTRYEGGFGEGRFGMGPFGGGPYFVVETDDNNAVDASQIIDKVISVYEALLLKHHLL